MLSTEKESKQVSKYIAFLMLFNYHVYNQDESSQDINEFRRAQKLAQ